MDFCTKLNFLMKLTQSSNKELAAGISVDRSLISLLRTGKRGMPRNHNHIQHMAEFFARRCTADFQRHALADMLGQTILRSAMPSDVLACYLNQWLLDDTGTANHIVNTLLDRLEDTPSPAVIPERKGDDSSFPLPDSQTTFYYGETGRRDAMRHMIELIMSSDDTGTIFAASDDNLEWLYEDFHFARKNLDDWIDLTRKGFEIHQIMPAMHFQNEYVESLQYWLSIYATGHVRVYYYPRLRDNLYRHATFIYPGHCVQAVAGIGSDSQTQITLVSTNPALVNAYTEQFQQYLSLCRPAILTHTDIAELSPAFHRFHSEGKAIIHKTVPLSANTMPAALLQDYIDHTRRPDWKAGYRQLLNEIIAFEEVLATTAYIDISGLASAEEVRSGAVPIASPYRTDDEQPVYTPQTYVLHLRNILRLMDTYENYYFVPLKNPRKSNYNLFAAESGIALLISSYPPFLMLEIHRPEMVQACWEYLHRIADRMGYDGIHRSKIQLQIKALIRELGS